MLPVFPLIPVRLVIACVVLHGAIQVDLAHADAEPAVPSMVISEGLPDSVDLPSRHREPLPDPTDCTITRLGNEVELDELLDDGLSTSLPPLAPVAEPVLGRVVEIRRGSGYPHVTGSPRGIQLRC